jgi:hypothetical protein
MARHMTGLRAWLRPPRNLLVFFILIVCLPAAAVVGLSFRLLDLNREKQQNDLLDRAGDEAVRLLEQNIAAFTKRLEWARWRLVLESPRYRMPV